MNRRAFAFASLAALAWAAASSAALAQARCADVAPGQRPQNTAREFVGQTLDDIIERGWIEFAVYEDFAPYSFMENDVPLGVDVEVGRIIAAALGVEARFRFVQAGENLDADLLSYVWKGAAIDGYVSNVMLRVPYQSTYACRHEQVVFTGQYAGETVAIAYAKSAYPDAVQTPDEDGRHPDAPVPAFFRFDTVAVENDSVADFYITGQVGAAVANVKRFKSIGEAMTALASGETMAAIGPRGQLEWRLPDELAVHKPLMPGFSVGRWTLGVAVHHSHRDLAYAVDDAISAALADGRIAAIHEKLGLTFLPPER
jgi:ABC-type amino acid transport substrate-binding protein